MKIHSQKGKNRSEYLNGIMTDLGGQQGRGMKEGRGVCCLYKYCMTIQGRGGGSKMFGQLNSRSTKPRSIQVFIDTSAQMNIYSIHACGILMNIVGCLNSCYLYIAAIRSCSHFPPQKTCLFIDCKGFLFLVWFLICW